MELMEGEKRNRLVFAGLIAFSVILWAFFFNASQLVFSEMVKFTAFNETLAKLTSINFILFLALFPLTFSIAVIAAKTLETREAHYAVLLGVALGLLLSSALFAALQEYWIIALLYLASFYLLVEMVKVREKELQRFAVTRISREATRRSVSLLAIGLFLFSVISIYPQNQQYVSELEESMVGVAMAEEGTRELSKAAAAMAVEAQARLLNEITSSASFQELKEVTDPRAQNFAAGLEETEKQVNSKEFKEKVLSEVQAQQTQALGEEKMRGVLGSMKEKIPVYGFITKYYWLVESIVVVSIFSFIANILFVVLAVIYSNALNKAVPLITKATAQKP